jgi:hypothetical protein
MITQRDLQHVVSQVNEKFEELFKRLEQLEQKKEVENASKKRSKTS